MKNLFLGILLIFPGIFSENRFLHAQMNFDFYQGIVAPTLNNAAQTKKPNVYSSSKTASTKSAESNSTSKFHIEAVLFGMDNYSDLNLPDLSGCNNDMCWLIAYFLKSNNFDNMQNSQISLLCDRPEIFDEFNEDPNDILKIQSPTRENFIKELNRVAQKECDRIIVAVSCHGSAFNGKSYLVPQESSPFPDQVASENIVEEIKKCKLIAIEEVMSILRNARTKEVLLILDACRSGSSSTDDDNKNFMHEFKTMLSTNVSLKNEQNRKLSLAVISSCSFGQTAQEAYDSGMFMFYLIKGLQGEADYTACFDGCITLAEAYNYAFSEVARITQNAQTPEILTSANCNNMILSSYAIPKPTFEDSDLTFLLKSGLIFLDSHNTEKNQIQTGIHALDCVLENVPNNAIAYSVRGNAHRRQGNYEQSLKDLTKVGQKFQLYANGKTSLVIGSDAKNIEKFPIENNNILTISQIKGNWLYVTEVDNVPLDDDQSGYINKADVSWDIQKAGNIIIDTQQMKNIIRSSFQNMISPGPGGTPVGGRPFIPI